MVFRTSWVALLVCAILATCGTVVAVERATLPDVDTGFAVEIGAFYTRGDYGGAETTETVSVPISLSYKTRRFLFDATIRYLVIDGPGVFVNMGGAMVPTKDKHAADKMTSGDSTKSKRDMTFAEATTTTVSTRESGFGDLFLSATWFGVAPRDKRPGFNATGWVKVATANENKRLGT
ncbi:MAG: hypothetical protein JSW10_00455, partial [Pseudomonadota bacterium]